MLGPRETQRARPYALFRYWRSALRMSSDTVTPSVCTRRTQLEEVRSPTGRRAGSAAGPRPARPRRGGGPQYHYGLEERREKPVAYQDGSIGVTGDALTIKGYYFPGTVKRVPLSAIRSVRRGDMTTFRGRGEYGEQSPRLLGQLRPEASAKDGRVPRGRRKGSQAVRNPGRSRGLRVGAARARRRSYRQRDRAGGLTEDFVGS